MAPYIVLKNGIFFNTSFISCNNFLPIKDKDNPPIKIINNIDNKISKPGIENGK